VKEQVNALLLNSDRQIKSTQLDCCNFLGLTQNEQSKQGVPTMHNPQPAGGVFIHPRPCKLE